MNGSTVLVIGYGRVAKACAKLFRAVGADVTISARKLSALAEAEGAGYHSSCGKHFGVYYNNKHRPCHDT